MEKLRGIMSTTHIDRHNERFDKEGLESAAQHINMQDEVMWVNWNHQTTLPPIGMIDKTWVAQLEDGEYGLYFEATLFSEGNNLIVTEDEEIIKQDIDLLDLKFESLGLSHDPRNFTDEDINLTLEKLGEGLPVEHRLSIRKSEVPQSVIWVIAAFIGGGIAAGFLNRVGEVIADKTIDASKPLLTNIGKNLSTLINKTIPKDKPDFIFLIQTPEVSEHIEGALETPTSEILIEACNKLPELYAYALKLIGQNKPGYFQDLKFLFNPISHKWEINFLTIKQSHKIVLGRRYFIPDHPLRYRYEQELKRLEKTERKEK